MSSRTVRIFISSTFRDMHAERDLLVREVFPELRRRCRPLRVEVVDVDLRWGVSEAEAEGSHALEVCLEEIRNSKPFFLGLLGERYGWIPPGEEHSITALEIINGVLAPRDAAGNPVSSEEHERIRARSFFYFRDPASITEVPTPYSQDVQAESPESAGKLAELKEEIRRCYQGREQQIYDGYPCRYRGQRLAYDLLDERQQALLADVAGEDYLVDREELGGLHREQQEIVLRSGVAHMGELSPLAERVTEDLWGAITAEYGEETVRDPAAMERQQHLLFGKERRRHFVGRREELRRIEEAARSNARVVVCGAPGAGKSAVLARSAEDLRNNTDAVVLERYVGASGQSLTVAGNRDAIWDELVAAGLTTYPANPEDRSGVRGDRVFRDVLAEVAAVQPLVVILDGVDQLSDRGSYIEWVQYGWQWPRGLTVLLGIAVPVEEAERRYPGWAVVEVPALGEAEQEELIREYLRAYGKVLTPGQQKQLLAKASSGSPLYLRVAAEELRVFARFEELERKIATLADGTEALFAQVLHRIETDTERELAASALGAIACGRGGITEQELLEHLSEHFGEPVAPGRWARIHRQLRPYMKETGDDGSGMLDFFHRELREAVRRRSADVAAAHYALGRYYEGIARKDGASRGYSEAAWQYLRGGSAGEEAALQLLTDFGYWMSRVEQGQLEGLVEDVRELEDVLTAAEREPLSVFAPWAAFLRERVHILRRGSREWPAHKILLQLAVEHADDSPITQQAEAWLAAGNGQWLWLRQKERPPYPLQSPSMAILEGHERRVNGIVERPEGGFITWSADGTIRLWSSSGKIETVIHGPNRTVQHVACAGNDKLLVLYGIRTDIPLLLASPGTKYLERISVWGTEFETCCDHIERITGFLVTHDSTIVTWGTDSILQRWSLEGDRTQILNGHTAEVTGAIERPSGEILSWSKDGTVRIWNTAGEQHIVLDHKGFPVSGVCELSDGGILSWDTTGTIRRWHDTGLDAEIYQAEDFAITGAVERIDGTILFTTTSGELLELGTKGEVTVREDESATVQEIDGALRLSDGRAFVWGEGAAWIWEDSDNTILWSVSYHEPVHTVTELADGVVATLHQSGAVRIWDTVSHTDARAGTQRERDFASAVLQLQLEFFQYRIAEQTGIRVDVESYLTCRSGDVILWSRFTHTDKENRLFRCVLDTGVFYEFRGHTDSIWGALECKDGRILSWSDDGTVRLWEPYGAPVAVLRGHDDQVSGAVQLRHQGFLSWGIDGTLRLWTTAGQPVTVLEGHAHEHEDEDVIVAAAEHTDGSIVSWTQQRIYHWHLTGKNLGTYRKERCRYDAPDVWDTYVTAAMRFEPVRSDALTMTASSPDHTWLFDLEWHALEQFEVVSPPDDQLTDSVADIFLADGRSLGIQKGAATSVSLQDYNITVASQSLFPRGNKNIRKMDIYHDATITATQQGVMEAESVEAFQKVINAESNLHQVDRYRRSLLHHAAMHNPNVPVLEHLIEKGLSIDARDYRDSTPLLLAAAFNGNADVSEALLRMGADPTAVDADGDTALHCAVFGGNSLQVIRTLVDHSVPINQTDRFGKLPVDYAFNHPDRAAVEELLQTKAGNDKR